jgi:hypothetical protein
LPDRSAAASAALPQSARAMDNGDGGSWGGAAAARGGKAEESFRWKS